jgi:hypothetical protein
MMSAAEQIEQLYAASFAVPFPYNDCLQLLKERSAPAGTLIPELDWYFGTVAGYSHSASRLKASSVAELQAAEKVLSKGFFDHFPQLESYRELIDEERTPELHRNLDVAERLRSGLLTLVHQALFPVGDPAAA